MAHKIVAKFLCFFLLMFLASFAFGQSKYNTTVQAVMAENGYNCQASNCFLPISGGGTFLTIGTGFDGYVLSVGTDHHKYTLPMTTPTVKSSWQLLDSGNNYYGFAVRNANEYYSLVYSSYCAPNGYAISRTLGSNTTTINGCLSQFSATKDDTLVGVNSLQQMWFSTNPQAAPSSVTWTHIPNGNFTYAVGLNASTAYALGGNQVYLVSLASKTYQPLSGAPSATGLAVTDRSLFVTAVGGAVWRLDFADNSWHLLKGTMSALFGNTQWSMFGINSGDVPYHYLSHALTASVNIHGYYDCSQFPNGCPRGAVHTATATAQYTGGTSASAQQSGTPADTLDATANAWAPGCDFFYGDAESSFCVIQVATGQVSCSIMGAIVTQALGGSVPKFRSETAFTRVKVTPGAPHWDSNNQRWYYSNITPECANTSTPDFNPQIDPGQVSDIDGHDLAMDVSSFGISINGAPWFWFNVGMDGGADANPGYEYDPGPTYCTVY